MSKIECAVCAGPLGLPLYESPSGRSLTSLCRIQPAPTRVYSCTACGHLQTPEIDGVQEYYDSQYDILVDSEEEDQIYSFAGGQPVYRTAHQVQTIRDKLDLSKAIDVLDYGCAKSSTLRQLCGVVPNATPYLFDVSGRYIPFWEQFASPGNWAINVPPPDWSHRFDLVTSFFSLEHIPRVAESVRQIAALLKPGGCFYAVVPNVFTNIADFIVADHCNHFTKPSLQHLLGQSGFDVREIDDSSHQGAYVIVAFKQRLAATAASVDSNEVEAIFQTSAALADYWNQAGTRVRGAEDSLGANEQIAIYGAGFYGAFVSSSLDRPDRIVCHLDQNPFLRGKTFNGRPVVAPEYLPEHLRQVFVGLNPANARKIIGEVPALAARDLQYFFL